MGIQAAVTELRTAIDLNPLDGHLHAILGSVYARLLRTGAGADLGLPNSDLQDTVLEAYRKASRLQPYMYSHRYELAKLLESLGEREQALSEYLVVLQIEPNFLPARERLARMYLHAGDRRSAQDQYHDILRRQQQYANYSYDPNAMVFLKVDAAGLEAELRAESPKT
jgi:tetratricopeptide (TPR) repeat protein